MLTHCASSTPVSACSSVTGRGSGKSTCEVNAICEASTTGVNLPDAETLLAASKANPLDAVTIGYGVANWHLYHGRRNDARAILSTIVEQYATTQWPGFGYIAAEADLARMR